MRPQEGALQIKFVVLAGLVSVLMGVVLCGRWQQKGPGVQGPGRASSTPWDYRNMGSKGMALAGDPGGGRSPVS